MSGGTDTKDPTGPDVDVWEKKLGVTTGIPELHAKASASPGAAVTILLVAVIATIFLFAASWEFWLEDPVSTFMGWHYEADFEAAARGRFISLSSIFAGLALVVPGIVLWRNLRSDAARQQSLSESETNLHALWKMRASALA